MDSAGPDWVGQGLDYWPFYAEIPPVSRAAYLAWLAGGRSHPDVPVGYVFLFFYGLERLALVDAAKDPSLKTHLPAITAEVRRLLELYGSQHSFEAYGGKFLEVLPPTPHHTEPDQHKHPPPPGPTGGTSVESWATSGIRTPAPDTMIHNAETQSKMITQSQAVDPDLEQVEGISCRC
jgi:hypothetical protein